jgi:hypothetical protein
MAPTLVRDGQFRLFFFAGEETRIHVHLAHPEGEAKCGLTPSVRLANNGGLTVAPMLQGQAVVETPIHETQVAWNRHFGGCSHESEPATACCNNSVSTPGPCDDPDW